MIIEPDTQHASNSQGIAVELLLEAGVVLAESLDLATTLERIAHMTVPRIADLCVIDLSDADGTIRQMAVASREEGVAEELRDLRERRPLDPMGEHPVARVIRSGEPERLAEMSGAQLRSFAAGSEHAQFMIERGYHSALVAPLLARQRTLGALSVLRLGDGATLQQRKTSRWSASSRAGQPWRSTTRASSRRCASSSSAWPGDPRQPRRGDHTYE